MDGEHRGGWNGHLGEPMTPVSDPVDHETLFTRTSPKTEGLERWEEREGPQEGN